MKCDHKIDPVERGEIVQELCLNEKIMNGVVWLMANSSQLDHDFNAAWYATRKKHGFTTKNVEKDFYISDNVDKVVSDLVKKANDGKVYEGALSKGFLNIAQYFLSMAEAMHHVEEACK